MPSHKLIKLMFMDETVMDHFALEDRFKSNNPGHHYMGASTNEHIMPRLSLNIQETEKPFPSPAQSGRQANNEYSCNLSSQVQKWTTKMITARLNIWRLFIHLEKED